MQTRSGPTASPAPLSVMKSEDLTGEWILDPGRSSIRLKSASVFGLVPVNGVFREVSAAGTVSPEGTVSGTVTVAAASIDTKNAKRDTHLRSADFFDSANHRDITFTAASVSLSDRAVAVTGALTVRDRTRRVSFNAAAALHGVGEIWLDAEVRINRADFGLTWNLAGMASMKNALFIHAVFRRTRR